MGQPGRNHAKLFCQNMLHNQVLYGPLQPLLTPWCGKQRLGESSAVAVTMLQPLCKRNLGSSIAGWSNGLSPSLNENVHVAAGTSCSCRCGWVVGKESSASCCLERWCLGLALAPARLWDLLFAVAMALGSTKHSSLPL